MPLELGIFLAAKKFGSQQQQQKKCIIFDRDAYRYQKFISDISGQDIHFHEGKPELLIQKLASWLRDHSSDSKVPGGKMIAREFSAFSRAIPVMCGTKHLDPAELTFQDFCKLAAEWILYTPSSKP